MNRPTDFPPVVSYRSLPGYFELVAIGLLQAGCLIGTALVVRQLFGGEHLLPDWTTAGLIGLLAGLGLTGAVSRWRERLRAESLAVHYVHELRLKLFDSTSLGAARPGLGVQMVRFSGDLTALRQWVSQGCARGISSILFIAGLLAAIALIYPPIAAAIGAILGLGILLSVIIGLRLERAVASLRASRGGLANKVSEALLHMPTIVSSGRAGKERKCLDRAGKRLNKAQLRRAFWQGLLRAMIDTMHRLCLLLVIAFGLTGATLTAADILALFAVVSLMTAPVRNLGRVYELWKNNKVARANLEPLLEQLEAQATPSSRLRTGAGALELRAGLIGARLRIDDFDIGAGARIAIRGDNGAGKTTLLQVVAGGTGTGSELQAEVYLDGELTRRLSDRDRGKAIGIAASEVALVDGSISKNLRYRLPRASKAAIERAIKDAGLKPLLDELPAGMMTRIGKGRLLPSQGQAARIKLARAIVGRPRLLLLDEIEAGMDIDGLNRLAAVIAGYPGSVIYATHNERLTQLADQIWTLHDDRIEITCPKKNCESAA